jgi:phenol 2-monooxygenase
MRGIDRTQGAVLVLRPDQHVSLVVPFSEVAEIKAFFAAVFLDNYTA